MATIQSTLSLQDRMSGTLSNIMNSMNRTSSAAMGISNQISATERAMSATSSQAANFQSRMDSITDAMDRNEAAIASMSRQQDIAFSSRRAADIQRLITQQDNLNNRYQSAELGLQRANNLYQTQQGRLQQLNQRLNEVNQSANRVQKSAQKSPFSKWQAKIITINQALMLTRRIMNGMKRAVSSVLDETKDWEGVANKFNKSINASKAALGQQLLPIAAVMSSAFASAFGVISQAAGNVITWITDHIQQVITGLSILGVVAAVAAGIFAISWAIANWPIIAIIAAVGALTAGLAYLGIGAEQVLGFVGGLFMGLLGTIQNVFIFWQNIVIDFVNFFGNVFNNPVGAIKVLFYDMANTVIGYVVSMAKTIEDVINRIPGVQVNITAGLGKFQSEIAAAAATAKDEAGFVEFFQKKDFKDVGEMIGTGIEKGSNIGASLSGLGDKLGNFNLSDYTAGAASGGGKALKTSDKGLEMAGEDIKTALDLATERFKVTYQTLTPQLSLNIDTVRENVNVDYVLEQAAVMLEEVATSRVVTA